MTETIHTRLEAARKASQPEAALLKTFRAYARGKQPGTLTSAQAKILRGVTGKRHADNVCKMVLLAATGRLALTRFEVPNAEVERWLKDFWTLSQIPVVAGQTHWATLRDGNHAVALSWDPVKQRVQVVRERWWNGEQGLWIAYDDLDQPLYAVKDWKTDKGLRRVIWWPDRIERYLADGNGWRPYPLDPTNGESWRAWWTRSGMEGGEPLGLPVVHFRNSYLPNDDDADASYGVSELDGGVLGLQDEVNDVQRDMTAGGRYTGYQLLTAVGYRPETDDAGKVKPINIEPGAMLVNPEMGGTFGAIPAGNLTQLFGLLHEKLQAVARQTATPLHLITGGDWPSGEALLRADTPLVKKTKAMIHTLGPGWASVAHKATVIASAFSAQPDEKSLDTKALITAVFADPAEIDPLTQADIAATKAPFVSKREVLRLLNYGPDDQTRILEEMDEDRAAGLADLLTPVDAGDDSPPAPGQVPPPATGAPSNGKTAAKA